jgi:acetyl esterase/lipase
MRLGLSLLSAFLLAAPAAQAAAPKVDCSDSTDRAIRLNLPVFAADAGETQDAFGYYALPAKKPKGIVVMAHGHGNSAWKWQGNVRKVADELGVIGVAMDYRRQTYPKGGIDTESFGWHVHEGAEDSIAAAQLFEKTCSAVKRPGKRKRTKRLPIIMFGVSMGGNTSGLAVAEGARRRDASPLFDWWFDVEGVANVIETYLEGRAAAGPPLYNATGQVAVREIEEEMGGPIESKSQVYADHSVVTRADDIKASGLKGVVMIHGADDGTVPFNQSAEMFGRLVDQGIPTDFFTVGRHGEGHSDGQTLEETLTIASYIPGYTPMFSGHGGENDLTHPVIGLAFERLARFFEEGRKPTCYRKVFYDEGTYYGDPSGAGLPSC